MKILFLTEDEAGASTRYRVRQFLPALDALEIDWELQAIPDGRAARRALFRRAGAFDRVVVQRRLVHPFDVRLLRKSARYLVFDFDDAILYPDSFSRKRRSSSRWLKFLSIASGADLVIAGNRYLAEVATEFQKNIIVIPTVLDAKRYSERREIASDSSRPLVLVWIGSSSTLPFLEDVLPSFEPLVGEYSLVLRVIADAAPRNSPLPVERIPWSEQTEAAALASSDIGLAPLRSDRWCHGKCGLRLLQYFASGVPAVATPVGVQADLIASDCGERAETAVDFACVVARLTEDATRREDLALRARARFSAEFERSVWVDRWVAAVTGRGEPDARDQDAGDQGAGDWAGADPRSSGAER